MDLDKLIYEMLKEGKSVKEISDATLNAQKKISEEQKSEELIADCRADLVDATITYLKALGLESFFERAIEYLDENKDLPYIIAICAVVGIIVIGIAVAVIVIIRKKKKTDEFYQK